MINNNGVTLVALVVTIIVLLILAGVSITMVVGPNGVITRTQSAVLKSNVAEAQDKLTIAWLECEADYITDLTNNRNISKADYFNKEDLDRNLGGIGSVNDFSLVEGGVTEVEYTFSDGILYTFEIDDKSNISPKAE